MVIIVIRMLFHRLKSAKNDSLTHITKACLLCILKSFFYISGNSYLDIPYYRNGRKFRKLKSCAKIEL